MKQQGDPLNEVKSLAGKIDKMGMGLKTTKDKPKRNPHHKSTKKNVIDKIEFKGGNLLDEQFDETLIYRPKTKQNKQRYENFKGMVHEEVSDLPPQLLNSIADEILAIILNEEMTDEEKQAQSEILIGSKIKLDKFIDFNIAAKALTDYKIDEDIQENIINLDDEQEEEGSDGDIIVENEEVEIEEEDGKIKKEESTKEAKGLDIESIDPNWLKNQLLQHGISQPEATSLEKEILDTLNLSSKLQCENQLLTLLNYQNIPLIKVLLQSRKTIYYGVKYSQCQHEKQKEQLIEEMRLDNIILQKKHIKKEVKSEGRAQGKMENESEERWEVGIVRDEEISRINRKILDLNLHDSSDKTKNAKQDYKFRLPEGASKEQKVGYEEIYVPPRKNDKIVDLIDISTLPSWMQPVFFGVKRFNPIQTKVHDHALKSDENMLVCAPTSAGKTNIALMAILKTISNYRHENFIDLQKFKIVYIAPMKALVAEITTNLSNRLKALGITVKELTGDMHLSKSQIEQTQIIISTPEKWDIITRKAGERLFVEQVRLLIIDEIHLLADQRGPVLESIIARTIRSSYKQEEPTRIVGLSATLPNYRDVGAVLRVNPKEGLFYFDQSFRPIPLETRYVGITEKKGVRKMLLMNEILYDKVIERVADFQMIIFVHSRRDTVRTANAIKELAETKNQLHKIMRPDSQSKNIIEAILEKETINSNELKELLSNGIGVHHAGLSRGDRDLVEQLFTDRHFNILVSTATLAWGVNLPAHTVIIKGTQVYSPEEGKWVELSMQDIMQMLGRAGRPLYDKEGEGIILSGYDQIRYYLNLLNMQIPLESQMLPQLPDQINAEVVLGSVANIKDAVNWLSFSYLYIRMIKNPKYYSITHDEIEEDKQLLRRRVNLSHTAFTILQRNGLVNYDRKNGGVTSTFLGKIAAFYYIKHASMKIYNDNLKSTSNLIDLFKIFALSIQFKYLIVREQEKNQLKKLVETVPVPVKGTIEEITTKISALLQAHISRLQLQGFALNTDKVYITQSASRIMRCLYEISLKKGWAQTTLRTLDMAKMIDKSMWSCLNPLRQFKNIPEYVLSKLEKKQQFSWQSFYHMSPQQIGDLTKFPKLGKILHKFVHHIPRISVQASAQPLTRSCLRIDATLTSAFNWQSEYHGNQEPFWLMVLDCNEETILYHYYFTLSKNRSSFSLQFIVPLFEIMHPLYYIKVCSDRWICSDTSLPLSFKSMVLPSKFNQPHQLMDLQLVNAQTIDSVAKEMKITHLNQIQTQAYQCFVNSTQNVFLGASQGSGKFSLAVFAMSQALQQGKKVILLVSHKSIVNKKHEYLSKIFPKRQVAKTYEDLPTDMKILANMELIVTTAAAWDVLSRRWKSRKGFKQIGLMVIDNLHLLGEEREKENASTLEVVISRMRYIQSEQEQRTFKIVCLSASLADYKEVAEWLGVPTENCLNFHPTARSNPVQVIFNTYDQPIRETRLHMMQKNLMQNVLHFNRSTLVVVSDKKQAKLTALDLVSELASENNPKKLQKIPQKQIETFSRKLTDHFLRHILEYGIGYIYEGMPEIEREIVEKLLQVEAITVLVMTQGLKWEINFKVFMVAVLDCGYYDLGMERWVDYSVSQMLQLMSLSCPSQKDRHRGRDYSSSKFMIHCYSPQKGLYKKFLFQPYPLESNLHLTLANHLNSQLVSKAIQTKSGCLDWITWTFMYRRLINNPNYYNMEDTSEETISTFLSEMIDSAVDYLVSLKCVEEEEDGEGLESTNLGIVCSYYYVKVESLEGMLVRIGENTKLRDVMTIVTQAHQLQNYQYKHKEYQQIAQLLTQANQKPLNKAHGLLLLHLYRIPMSQQLLHECREMLPTMIRITHALVDIISSFGYLKPLILTMQLCQMIIQGMWINDSPLFQVMDKATAKTMQEHYNVKDINDFIDMDDEERKKALKGKDIDKIAHACNRFPIINLSCKVLQRDDNDMSLQVKLERDEELSHKNVISNHYPQEKEQYWWVVIGDKKNNKVLTTKRTTVDTLNQLKMEVEFEENVDKIVIYALCDSYVGCDQAEEMDLN